MIGAVSICIIIFVLILYINPKKKYNIDDIIRAPPIGSLRFELASLEISLSQSQTEFSGVVVVEFINTTDKLISYVSTTEGCISNFKLDKTDLAGFAYPNETSYIVSRRLTGLPVEKIRKGNEIFFYASYKYEIQYRYVGETKFIRRTSKEINLSKMLFYKYEKVIDKNNFLTFNHVDE